MYVFLNNVGVYVFSLKCATHIFVFINQRHKSGDIEEKLEALLSTKYDAVGQENTSMSYFLKFEQYLMIWLKL